MQNKSHVKPNFSIIFRFLGHFIASMSVVLGAVKCSQFSFVLLLYQLCSENYRFLVVLVNICFVYSIVNKYIEEKFQYKYQ